MCVVDYPMHSIVSLSQCHINVFIELQARSIWCFYIIRSTSQEKKPFSKQDSYLIRYYFDWHVMRIIIPFNFARAIADEIATTFIMSKFSLFRYNSQMENVFRYFSMTYKDPISSIKKSILHLFKAMDKSRKCLRSIPKHAQMLPTKFPRVILSVNASSHVRSVYFALSHLCKYYCSISIQLQNR